MDAQLAAKVRQLKSPRPADAAGVAEIEKVVKSVLAGVRERGDAALRDYSREFDRAEVESLEITSPERQAAIDALNPQMARDTQFAIERVRDFAQAQLGTMSSLEVEPLPGLHLGHRLIPIARVGAYVPARNGSQRDEAPKVNVAHLPHARRETC